MNGMSASLLAQLFDPRTTKNNKAGQDIDNHTLIEVRFSESIVRGWGLCSESSGIQVFNESKDIYAVILNRFDFRRSKSSASVIPR